MTDFLRNHFGGFGPHKGFGAVVVKPDELVDRRDQLRHAREDASSDPLAGDLGKPSLHQVQPRGAGWRKVQMEAGMLLQPRLHMGMGVRPVVRSEERRVGKECRL